MLAEVRIGACARYLVSNVSFILFLICYASLPRHWEVGGGRFSMRICTPIYNAAPVQEQRSIVSAELLLPLVRRFPYSTPLRRIKSRGAVGGTSAAIVMPRFNTQRQVKYIEE